jgi:hypothetical protein
MRGQPLDGRPRGARAPRGAAAGGMTGLSGNARPGRSGMAYFIRRRGDDCSVIALHPDDREEVIATGLPIGDAEDLCVSKIEAMRGTKPALPFADIVTGPAPAAPPRKKHGGRQLAFRF